MKILIAAVFLSASLMACGGKAKKTTTPDNKTGTTETQTDGTGGTTYGGAQTPTPPASGGDPCAGQ